MNDLTVPGVYWVRDATINKPTSLGGLCIIGAWSPSYVTQVFVSYAISNDIVMYIRSKDGTNNWVNSWSPLVRKAVIDDINSRLGTATNYFGLRKLWDYAAENQEEITLDLRTIDPGHNVFSMYLIFGNQGGGISFSGIGLIACSGYAGGTYIKPVTGGSDWINTLNNNTLVNITANTHILYIKSPSTVHFSIVKIM